jgi:UDP-glucose 4-epimerase
MSPTGQGSRRATRQANPTFSKGSDVPVSLEGATVLVTGGAGFIGSELVHQLCASNARVIVIDNLVNGKAENLAGLPGDRCELVIADVRDRAAMAAQLQGVDVVYHLACLGVRHSIHSPTENHDVNATATLHLLQAAKASGVGRFVYVSSSEVYGTAKTVPMTEEHPAFPLTVYGASKLAGERYTQAYHRTYDYPTVVVRPFNAYGPRSHHEGDCGEVIPKFMLRALAGLPLVVFGDGSQTRDFTFVADTARGVLAAGFAEAAIGHTINVGYGAEVTVSDLARLVGEVTGVADFRVAHDEPRPGDVLRLFADSARAKQLLGYTPTISLREGLSRLRDWYLASAATPAELLKTERVRNWEPVPTA